MHKYQTTKPDGRNLILYGRAPIPPGIKGTSPSKEKVAASPHLRWHPLRGEWVAYASHRQNRTFLPPKEYNPLAVTTSPEHPTELPPGAYDIAVFENLFPTLTSQSQDAPGDLPVKTVPAHGACEVVVFTQDPDTSLGKLPLDHIALLLEVWGDRYRDLASRPEIKYVMPFENRGVEVGVTLHHPHGQIYAYPFVPPVPARELALQRQYLEDTGRGLVADIIASERRDSRRLVADERDALAFVPPFARYPFEVWIAPARSMGSVVDLSAEERKAFAKVLKTVLLKFDKLWNRPFPYLMVLHQAPTDGEPHPEAHFHIEIYPALRAPNKLKYLAGTELGAGMFANDALPEETAATLRAVEVSL